MINYIIKLILILLIVFTPIAFGSFELWAFSLMELGILLIIILWTIQTAIFTLRSPGVNGAKDGRNPWPVQCGANFTGPQSAMGMVLLCVFLLLILFQLLPLPSGIIKTISPKTYELRNSLSTFDSQLLTLNSKFSISFFPFATKIEFFKWLTLISLFFFLLHSKILEDKYRVMRQLIIVIMLVGVAESLYGMFEFFSGHKYILHRDMGDRMAFVTGTFINRNHFAGYLLMVIPLSVGFLFSREAMQIGRFRGWRERLVSLDGKTLLIGFSVIVMILGLLFSASRMGISSLLLSFTLLSFLIGSPSKEHRFSRTSILILGLALLWAAWIGLDAVISRFLTSSEDFKGRWEFWVNTFQIFKDFPIFGSGLGTFAWVFPMYRSFHLIGIATHAENDFLQLTSEVGIVGIGLLLIIFLFLLYKAIAGIHSFSHRESGRYIGMGSLVGILALMFHSIVEKNIQVPSNAFLYTILWAIVLRISLGGVSKSNNLITQ